MKSILNCFGRPHNPSGSILAVSFDEKPFSITRSVFRPVEISDHSTHTTVKRHVVAMTSRAIHGRTKAHIGPLIALGTCGGTFCIHNSSPFSFFTVYSFSRRWLAGFGWPGTCSTSPRRRVGMVRTNTSEVTSRKCIRKNQEWFPEVFYSQLRIHSQLS